MGWRVAILVALALVLALGFLWYERSRPSSRVVALVAALAALAVAGRLLLAPIPNVVATTDVAFLTGFALGGPPGFAVGALAAPISNLWLGQGPWTVWQMAGWGLAGLAGAGLAAVAGRELGRLWLAASCAAVGLLYGALLDLSVMVTYGGEQSLDRYLALSARGIPFNVAHAAGNFAIALAAGPALVRMIGRFRERSEHTWYPAGALPAALAALALAGAALGPAPARAGDVGSARAWLERAREADGGYPATPGGQSSPQMTGWAMLGLEAAGRNPLDVGPRGGTPVDYLRRHARRLRSIGDLERTILALEGAGLGARRLTGRNLVAELRARQDGDGSFDSQVNLTAYGILALRAAGAGSGTAAAAAWLARAQNGDGGWGFGAGQGSDPDSTGAAMQGLAAADMRDPLTAATAYLRRVQRSDGGWGLNETGVTNSQSTAWAVQGLVAARIDPDTVSRRGKSGLDYLRARQRSDGSYAYSATSTQTPVWVTAQALLAVSLEALPIEPVRRSGEAGPAPTPSPDVAPGAEPPGSTAPSRGGGGADGAARPRGGARGHRDTDVVDEGNEGGRRGRRGRGEAARPARSPVAGPAASDVAAAEPDAGDPGGGSPGVAVGGGLGGLALALAAGWLWYRRTLP